jgi:hypothetical protein
MSEEKGLGRKILGLFVEQSEGEAEGELPSGGKSAADLVAELAQQSGAAPAKGAPPPAPGPGLTFDKVVAPVAGAAIDFDAVFKDAGMDGEDLNRVRKSEELLKGLPEATPQDIKKQIVEASLKAFGFDVAKISAAASNQKRALDAYVKVNEQLTAKGITDARRRSPSSTRRSLASRGTSRSAPLRSRGSAAPLRRVRSRCRRCWTSSRPVAMAAEVHTPLPFTADPSLFFRSARSADT